MEQNNLTLQTLQNQAQFYGLKWTKLYKEGRTGFTKYLI